MLAWTSSRHGNRFIGAGSASGSDTARPVRKCAPLSCAIFSAATSEMPPITIGSDIRRAAFEILDISSPPNSLDLSLSRERSRQIACSPMP